MLKGYTKTSPIAKVVRLEGHVILNRRKMCTDELLGLEAEGEFSLSSSNFNDCELEVNGLPIAAGRIVRKKGDFFFKVQDMEKGTDK